MIKIATAGIVFATLAMPAAVAEPRPGGSAAPTFSQAIPNIPGKSLVAVTVTYPPRGASRAHSHAPSAFIFAYVLDGAIRSSVDGAPAKIYQQGESWHELPGAHHGVSENASDDKPAHLLAIFVVDSAEKILTKPDPK